MKVGILRGFCLGKGVDVFPGDTADIPDGEARVLERQGKVTADLARFKKLFPKRTPPAQPAASEPTGEETPAADDDQEGTDA